MAQFKKEIHDFWSAEAFLNGRRERKLAHNTVVLDHGLEFGDRVLSVKYHYTIIVRYISRKAIQLNSGGWETSTTKERINKLLPPEWGLSQEKFVWKLWNRITDKEYLFEDNMIINLSTGQVFSNEGEEIEATK